MIDAEALAVRVTSETGLPFLGRQATGSGGEKQLLLTPAGHHAAQTFQLVIRPGWRSLDISFEQGAFSADLVAAMGSADESGRKLFHAILDSCTGDGAAIVLRVNGNLRPHEDPDLWRDTWRKLEFSIRKGQLPLGIDGSNDEDQLIVKWTARSAAAVVGLLPLEDATSQIVNDEGLPEGALLRVEVNRYERDRRNRAAALAIHGFGCRTCGLLLTDRYGSVAADFIEVHHVVPVSAMGTGYIVDPRSDLVPLCPNCHAIAHRRSPPFTVDEIRQMIGGQQQG